MGTQLSMLDTMFLELEQVDETAHMHIGAALIFDPLPTGGTPGIGELRDHMRERVGILPRFAQQLSGPRAGSLKWLTWEPAAARPTSRRCASTCGLAWGSSRASRSSSRTRTRARCPG